MSKIKKALRRIIQQTGTENLIEVLSEALPPTDLQSLLLHVFEKRVDTLTPNEIFKQYRQNRFVTPCSLSQREMVRLDGEIYQALPPKFTAIEFSPVIALGTNHVLTSVNQKTVLSTIRNVEVIADPTTALTLEAARIRSERLAKSQRSGERVRLSTSQRNLRLQDFRKIPGFTQHFRAFALATAGRDIGHEKFERQGLVEHLGFYLGLLRRLKSRGWITENVRVDISDIRITERIIAHCNASREEVGRQTQNPEFDIFQRYDIPLPPRVSALDETVKKAAASLGIKKPLELLEIIGGWVFPRLKQRFPKVAFGFDLHRLAGIGYYQNLCFKITAENSRGERFPLTDGGMSDWTQKLLNSRKERLLTSGIGTELLAKKFATEKK